MTGYCGVDSHGFRKSQLEANSSKLSASLENDKFKMASFKPRDLSWKSLTSNGYKTY